MPSLNDLIGKGRFVWSAEKKKTQAAFLSELQRIVGVSPTRAISSRNISSIVSVMRDSLEMTAQNKLRKKFDKLKWIEKKMSEQNLNSSTPATNSSSTTIPNPSSDNAPSA